MRRQKSARAMICLTSNCLVKTVMVVIKPSSDRATVCPSISDDTAGIQSIGANKLLKCILHDEMRREP